jgi:hypothetical protein
VFEGESFLGGYYSSDFEMSPLGRMGEESIEEGIFDGIIAGNDHFVDALGEREGSLAFLQELSPADYSLIIHKQLIISRPPANRFTLHSQQELSMFVLRNTLNQLDLFLKSFNPI